MKFSQSTHLLMFLSLDTLTSIIRTGLPILVELINLVNSVIIFLSQMTLLRWLTFLRGSQTVILIVLLFWTYFFLLTLLFVPQWLSLHWEILVMWLSGLILERWSVRGFDASLKVPFLKHFFFSIWIKCVKNILIRGIQPPQALLDCPNTLLSNKGAFL